LVIESGILHRTQQPFVPFSISLKISIMLNFIGQCHPVLLQISGSCIFLDY